MIHADAHIMVRCRALSFDVFILNFITLLVCPLSVKASAQFTRHYLFKVNFEIYIVDQKATTCI